MALRLTLHSDLWPPCGQAQEQISHERIKKKKKKRQREEVTFCCTVLVSLTLKSGQTKVSLENFLRAQVKWGFWSGTPHVSHFCQYTIICTVALLLCVMPRKKNTVVLSSDQTRTKNHILPQREKEKSGTLQSENGKFLLFCLQLVTLTYRELIMRRPIGAGVLELQIRLTLLNVMELTVWSRVNTNS